MWIDLGNQSDEWGKKKAWVFKAALIDMGFKRQR